MTDPTPDGLVLREIFTYGPGEHTFIPADYPWVRWMRVFAKGGDAGPDGQDGALIVELYGEPEEHPS